MRNMNMMKQGADGDCADAAAGVDNEKSTWVSVFACHYRRWCWNHVGERRAKIKILCDMGVVKLDKSARNGV